MPPRAQARRQATAPRAQDAFDALGNPQRRAIVERLAERPHSVQELADELPISRPAVSRHLRLLSDAGLVTDQQVGTRRLYRLEDLGAHRALAYLQRVWGDVATRFQLLAENTVTEEKRD